METDNIDVMKLAEDVDFNAVQAEIRLLLYVHLFQSCVYSRLFMLHLKFNTSCHNLIVLP